MKEVTEEEAIEMMEVKTLKGGAIEETEIIIGQEEEEEISGEIEKREEEISGEIENKEEEDIGGIEKEEDSGAIKNRGADIEEIESRVAFEAIDKMEVFEEIKKMEKMEDIVETEEKMEISETIEKEETSEEINRMVNSIKTEVEKIEDTGTIEEIDLGTKMEALIIKT